jgi:hypothetical protein
VIGFLHEGLPAPSHLTAALGLGLAEAGVNEGRGVTIENRWAEGQYDRLPALAADLIEHRVEVIAAAYLVAARAAKAATWTVPIVFVTGSDPVAADLVSSLNRPTGNVTGVAFMFTRLGPKNLEILHELVPNAALPSVTKTPPLPSGASRTAAPKYRTLRISSTKSSSPTGSRKGHGAPPHRYASRARAIALAHFRCDGQSGSSLIGFWYFGSRGSPSSAISRCNGVRRAACLANRFCNTRLSCFGQTARGSPRYISVFEQRRLTVWRIVMSGNDSKLPCHLITAAYQGDVETAIVQLGEGTDVNARDGDTALMLAAQRGHIEAVKLLLKNGADVNAMNLNGETALMRAAENDRAATVKILLAHHADGNAGDNINCTPLMRAAYRGYVDVVKELLDYGADAKARNKFGNTPATLAAHNGHSEIESMLREADDIGFVDSVPTQTPRCAPLDPHRGASHKRCVLRDEGPIVAS